MLYRTPNPLSFPFTLSHPLPPSSTVAAAAAPLPFHVQRVECLETALKKGEMEDFSVNNGQNDAAGEDFFVDDLLVDGEDGFFGEETGYEHGPEAEDNKPRPVALSPVVETEQKAEQKTEEGKGCGFSAIDDFDSVPAADLADLEWLSHFVEDSLSGYSLRCPVARLPEKPTGNRSEPDKKTAVEAKPLGGTPVQTKARSKRTRTGGRVWSLGGSPSLTESSSSTSSSSTTSDTWLIFGNPSQTAESLLGQTSRPSVKKQRKRKVITGGGGSGQPRRCSHCGVQKTPQWRTGPNGAKTLCNACGVRFKSGRLFPEYRPACSPTFSSEMHSNSHRKVLEMRRKKEAMVAVGPSPVQSF